jgi:hypothetical protein
MPFGLIRCPECNAFGRARGRRFAAPIRKTFGGAPAPYFDQERVCLACGAWLWVVGNDVELAAPRLFTMSLIPTAEPNDRLDAVLAGIAATEAFQREFSVYVESSAAWPSAIVNRFS